MGYDRTDDFFRDVYNSELEHKHKLDSADSLLVGVLLALSGVGIYYLKVLPSCGHGIVGYVFLALSALFLIAFGFATGFVIASFWPRDKGYISNPEEWGRYVVGLEDYYGHYHDRRGATERTGGELARTLRGQYIKAGEINRRLNIKKMGYQTWVRRCITGAVVILALNAYPTCLVQCAKSEVQKTDIIKFPEIQKVEIVTPEARVESNDRRRETSHAPTATATTSASETGATNAASSRDSAGQRRPDAPNDQERKVTDKE